MITKGYLHCPNIPAPEMEVLLYGPEIAVGVDAVEGVTESVEHFLAAVTTAGRVHGFNFVDDSVDVVLKGAPRGVKAALPV